MAIISTNVEYVRKYRDHNLRGNNTFSLMLRFSESFVKKHARLICSVHHCSVPCTVKYLDSFLSRDSERYHDSEHRSNTFYVLTGTLNIRSPIPGTFMFSLRNTHCNNHISIHDVYSICNMISTRLNVYLREKHGNDMHQWTI